jgi:hypothetical protein
MNAVVITMRSTPERLMAFMEGWSGGPIRVFYGIEGLSGVAGCFQSHLGVLSTSKGPTLVLEDDAVFARPIPNVFCVPEDCDVLFLGGEHLEPPERVSGYDDLVRCTSIRRSHAYLALDAQTVAKMLRKRTTGHLDYALNDFVPGKYAVHPFIVGQGPGKSIVTGHDRKEVEFWNWKAPI